MPCDIGSDDKGFGLESVVFDALADHTRFRTCVVAGVTVALVLASLVEDECIEMGRLPCVPSRVGERNQFEGFSRQRSFDAPTKELAPESVGLVVIHDQRIHDELAGHAEGVLLTVYESGITYSRKAKRSPCHGDRFTPNDIVHDLVPAQHRDRVGPMLSPQ